ncbi:MAG TPA: D-alanyl-D-alanine carboxypeptidase [Micromonosporaceae bacterium]|nr:D-alanyl-D-alanine carboxypeptidase [Micromonosporaceae bacterium]
MAHVRTLGSAAALAAFVLLLGYPWGRRTPEPAPPPPGTVSTLTTLTVPGTPPAMPWPHDGQAAVEVRGIGPLGSSGITAGPVPVASIAKAMTALQVLADHPIEPGQEGPGITVTADEAAAYTAEAQRGESHLPVRAGEVLTERDALEAIMLPSANNIARILARWDAGSVDAFVTRMNFTAAVLGMTRTRYTDPAGFDPGTVSTVADQVILAERAMGVPTFAQIVAMRTATIPLAGTVHNVNRLLGTAGVVGIKTGSMTQSGGCLLFAARAVVGGRSLTIVGVVLGQPGLSYRGLAPTFDTTQDLVTAAAAAVRGYRLLPAGAVVGQVGGGDLVTAAPVTVLGWPGLAFAARLSAAVAPTTPDGATVGRLDVTGGDTHVTVAVTLRRH